MNHIFVRSVKNEDISLGENIMKEPYIIKEKVDKKRTKHIARFLTKLIWGNTGNWIDPKTNHGKRI